jgi:acyl dehydratase
MSQPKWYFDDFEVDRLIDAGSYTVTEEEIIDFAKQFDPQPFHVDRTAAAQSVYGGIIASGWHTCSLMMRLVVTGVLGDAAGLGSPGVDEIRWLKPVRGGDKLMVTIKVLECLPSTSKPDRGVVVMTWEAKNQRGEVVATLRSLGLFQRRPA